LLKWGWGKAPWPRFLRRAIIRESPIFVKTYDFAKWLLEHTIKFPKSQRFVMAKQIEEALRNFLAY
jgi:hypothetical protein